MTRRIFALLVTAALSLSLFGCGKAAQTKRTSTSALVQTAQSAPAAEGIKITGLPGGTLTLTAVQLENDFELTELDAVSINSKGDEKQVHAKGVLLETILRQNGALQQDFGSVAASASDGYAITIPEDVLRRRDILIAFETNGERIAPRVVVPEERAMYWVKDLRGIELAGQIEAAPVTRELKLNDLVDRLRSQAEDYKYYDASCKALPMALLLREIGAEQAATVTIRAADGLVKSEKYETFAAQMLIVEGTPDAPVYIGPSLPTGMRVKCVASFQVGGILVKAE